jgi:threonine synthase
MVGAQPANCAPLVANWEKREFGGCQGSSLAEGTQIETPVRARQILSLLDPSRDALVAITEDELLSAWQALAKMGFYVEPTSALVWAACDKLIDDLPEPVVLVFSGSGLKFSQQSIK